VHRGNKERDAPLQNSAQLLTPLTAPKIGYRWKVAAVEYLLMLMAGMQKQLIWHKLVHVFKESLSRFKIRMLPWFRKLSVMATPLLSRKTINLRE